MTVDDVIILGAGASAADGAPLQNGLFRSYFQHKRIQDDELSANLKRFFLDFFGIDVVNVQGDTEYPTFEEILGVLELAIARGESFKHYPLLPASPKIQTVREHLVFLIARILKETLARGRGNHESLIRCLAQQGTLNQTG